MQDWKDHLEAQLDSLLGKTVKGKLNVLPGHKHRLEGGTHLCALLLYVAFTSAFIPCNGPLLPSAWLLALLLLTGASDLSCS